MSFILLIVHHNWISTYYITPCKFATLFYTSGVETNDSTKNGQNLSYVTHKFLKHCFEAGNTVCTAGRHHVRCTAPSTSRHGLDIEYQLEPGLTLQFSRNRSYFLISISSFDTQSADQKKPPNTSEEEIAGVCAPIDSVWWRSKVWLNFNKRNQSSQCNTCNKIISCKGGSINNMVKCPVFDVLRWPSSAASSSAASSSASDPQPSTALQSESGKTHLMPTLRQLTSYTRPKTVGQRQMTWIC